jgi:hypothetical protein
MGLLNLPITLRACSRAPVLTFAGAILSVLLLSGARYPDATPAHLETEAREARAASADRIEIISITSDRIRGRLIHGSIGVVFDSSKNETTAALVVKTLQVEELLSVRQRASGILVAIGEWRLRVEIDQEALLNLRRAQIDGTLAALLHAPPVELRARLQPFVDADGNSDAVQSLQRVPEYALMPSVSWELGRLGIAGRRFPASLAIHAVGLGAAWALQIDPRQSGVVYERGSLPEMRAESDALAQIMGRTGSDCWDRRSELLNPGALPECPEQCKASPDPEQACMGMCGRGCGDCGPGCAVIAATIIFARYTMQPLALAKISATSAFV